MFVLKRARATRPDILRVASPWESQTATIQAKTRHLIENFAASLRLYRGSQFAQSANPHLLAAINAVSNLERSSNPSSKAVSSSTPIPPDAVSHDELHVLAQLAKVDPYSAARAAPTAARLRVEVVKDSVTLIQDVDDLKANIALTRVAATRRTNDCTRTQALVAGNADYSLRAAASLPSGRATLREQASSQRNFDAVLEKAIILDRVSQATLSEHLYSRVPSPLSLSNHNSHTLNVVPSFSIRSKRHQKRRKVKIIQSCLRTLPRTSVLKKPAY